jgi:stearoyl-CoA desaturase (delta-9 desaturase)
LNWWYIPFVFISGFIFVRIITEEILHKGISHNLYKKNKILDWVWAWSAVLLGQGSSLGWANIHRQHHAYSDTIRDPQSVFHQPFWKVYTGIFYTNKKNPLMVKDLMRCKSHVFTHKYYNTLHIITCITLFIINPLILLVFISPGIVYSFHSLGLINTLSHLYGNKVKNTQGKNLWWVSYLVCFNQEQHADHHKYPTSSRNIIFKRMLNE